MSRKGFLCKNLNLLSKLYNGIHTVYGPYIAKDGRRRVILYDGYRRITRQYCKVKMEIRLEKRLSALETIDHVDRNVLNDAYSNLRVLNNKKHASLDAQRLKARKVKCIWCKSIFEQKRRRKAKSSGPFCSKSCSGKYGSYLQNGKVNKLKPKGVELRDYYTLKCLGA